MSEQCNDPRFREMLHNYELGLLSEEEETEFELHLYSCDYCLKKIEAFRETARHLKFDPVIRTELEKLAVEPVLDQPKQSFFKPLTAAKWSPAFKISMVAAAVFVIVLLNLVRIEFGGHETAQASTNNVVVTDFKNISGDAGADQLSVVAMNLLITDLSESPSVHIVSNLRLKEILLYLGYDPKREIDKKTAFEIAAETESNVIVEGNILQARPNLVLTAQVIDVKSGVIMASKKIAGEVGENIFSIIDRLAAEIRKELLPRTVVDSEIDCSISDIMTHSEEAYYLYIQGLEDDWAFRYAEARKNFLAAIEKDTTFAMAYYLMSYFSTGAEQTRMITKAIQYSEKCSCKERYFIRSRQALLMGDIQQAKNELREMLNYYPQEKDALSGLGDLEARSGNLEVAVKLYEEVIAVYPRQKNVYNELAYLYSRLGNFEKAASALDNYIKLAPGEPNPWDSKGEIYARYGHIEEAFQDFKHALQIDSGYGTSKRHLIMIFLLNDQYDSARTYINALMNDDELNNISYAWYNRAVMEIRQGLFNTALKTLDDGIARDMDSRYRILAVQKHWQKAMILQAIDRPDEALQEIDRCLTLNHLVNPNDKLGHLHYKGQFLAERGKFVDAERVAENIRKDLGGTGEAEYGYKYVKGCLALAGQNPGEAIKYFEEAAKLAPSQSLVYLTARAYLEAGRPEKTIEILETDRKSYNTERIDWSMDDIKAGYYLGLAYEKSGQVAKAVQNYDAFMQQWSDADVETAEIRDARKRLTRLKS
ncbi:MAG: tetratricopeptide repeat protein [Candidatus Zixiibacteriota bacterium]